MTYSFASQLYSKIATLDKDTLAAVVFGLLLGAIVIKSIFTSIFAKKPPATFRCARCRREVPHDKRTIEAWRSDKRKFFCQECHNKWRETHQAIRTTVGSGRGGCMLPLTLILSLFALGAYAMMR
jgi:hypothetical protein